MGATCEFAQVDDSAMNAGWVETVLDQLSRHTRAAVVTVVRADGSTPREAGAAMVVTVEATHGTIGGGALEYEAIARARAFLAQETEPKAWRRETLDLPLGPTLGQCCGGFARLLIEIFTHREGGELTASIGANASANALMLRPLVSGVAPAMASHRKDAGDWPLPVLRAVRDMLSGARPNEALLLRGHKGAPDWFVAPLSRRTTPLYLFGAGHVGRAVARVLEGLPFDLVWIDTARARFPAAIPAFARIAVTSDPASLAAQAPPGAFHLVMTYSHPLDLAICHALLRRGDFAYLGLIGSRTKRARFVKRLAEAGIPDSMLGRLTCPIGIPGLSGKEPPMIAVSTAADLIQRLAAADKRAEAVES